MKYKMLLELNIDYDDEEEFTEEEWDDIKKAYEQEYIENGIRFKINILEIKKDS